ncbi:Major facilitator superfamily domain, general substrate transporter [Tolypocladium paradoxum]|uniref:Major facilitator superfamily domain, general substrate transporter n=1 Tax=Tolypocladium paradoxum TaxID=94208 RepID=A0A2S4KZG0_9HYPO|nr:Major facilitator superfamily domain, general substrate transporter [Tolypocladium paradoxum]
MDWDINRPVAVTRPASIYSPEPPARSLSMGSTGSDGKATPPSPPPLTSPSRRLSFGSFSSHHRTVKHGRGRYSDVELVPQPSDDPDDPLNWPRWRKDLNLVSLLMTVGLVGGMKTAFVTTGGAMAIHYNVSYTAVAALTAVPIIMSTVTGFVSSVAAKFWGKRPMYLASAALLFIGSIWNTTAGDSYGFCMGARVFQGLGWGAFDTLVMGSIQDTYYEHERNLPVSLYNVFTIATTWGSPLVGGVASTNAGSFTDQFRIICGFYVLAVPLLALGAPETTFDRSTAAIARSPVPGMGGSSPWRPWRLRHRLNKETAVEFVKGIKLLSFRCPLTLPTALQAPRALVAPTTCLLFVLSFIPYGALWGLATSIALVATPLPLALDPAKIGTLTVGPWIFATFVVGGFCFYRGFHQKFTRGVGYGIIAVGTFLVLIGVLSFGLGICNFMTRDPTAPNRFFIPEAADQLSLPLLSFQLGALAGGLYVLDTTTRPVLARSTSFTASSIAVAQRSIGDMHACVVVLRNLAAGVFIMAMPSALAHVAGLRAAVIGLAVTQVLVAGGIVALWWFFDEAIWRADGTVMGLVDLRLSKQSESFFDDD